MLVPVRRSYRSMRARVRTARRNGARLMLALIVLAWVVDTWTVEVLSIVVCVAFAVAIAGGIKLARDGRPGTRLLTTARADIEVVRTRGYTRGAPGTVRGAIVYDDQGKRQYCYTMGGFSFWNPDHLEAIKVGHSNAPRVRVGQVQADERGLEWRLLSFCDGGEPLERGLHARLAEYRLPRSELFIPHADALEVVRELAESDGGEITAAGTWVLEHIDPEQYRSIRREADR